MEFHDSREQEILIVELVGDLDISSSPAFKEKAAQWVDRGERSVLLDFTRVPFMDSSGLGSLVGVLKRLKEQNGKLALCGLSRDIAKVLEVTKLDRVIPIYPDREAALEALKS